MNNKLITIGIPVFNGEKHIASALESILLQSINNFELIVSDNCSTDSTSEIILNYSKQDSRIKYFRQAQNIGAAQNFLFLLNQSNTKYFKWVSADDVISNNFIECNLDFLEKNQDYVASTSPNRFLDTTADEFLMGDFSLNQEDPVDRIISFFVNWHANGRHNSIFRTFILKKSFESRTYLGSDWSTIINMLCYGKMHRHNIGEAILGRYGESNRLDFFRNMRCYSFNYALPFFNVIENVFGKLKSIRLDQLELLSRNLLALNQKAVELQIDYEKRLEATNNHVI